MKISESLKTMLAEMDSPVAKAIVALPRATRATEVYKPDPVSLGFAHWSVRSCERYSRAQTRIRRFKNPSPCGDFFSFREKAGLISYCPKGRQQQITDDGKWERAGRQEIKPARWAKSILSPRVIRLLGGDKALNEFASKFSAMESGADFSVKIVDCAESTSWNDVYRSSQYDGCGGSSNLAGSCMRDKPVGEFYSCFDCSPVQLSRSGKLVGRAILWHNVHLPDGNTISLLDRVYATTPSAEVAFLSWARANNYHHKEAQGMSVYSAVSPAGTSISLYKSCVKGDWSEADFLPYMDTFFNGDSDKSKLRCNYEYSDGYTLHETDGTAEGGPDDHEGEVRTEDGDWIDEDEAVHIDGYGYVHQDDDNIAFCDGCGEYHLTTRTDMIRLELPRNNSANGAYCSDYFSSL